MVSSGRGEQAAHRGPVGALVATGERLGAAVGLLGSGLPGWKVEVLKQLPAGGLDLGLGGGGDLGKHVLWFPRPTIGRLAAW